MSVDLAWGSMTDQQTPPRPRASKAADGVEIVPFDERHLAGILQLCVELRWPSLPTDAKRALRALTAPGVTTVVAVVGGPDGDGGAGRDGDGAPAREADQHPVGFAQILSDGAIQAYLALLAVDAGWRRRGIGHRLVRTGFARSGAERLDVLASPTAERFYRTLRHKRLPGYRVYPHLS